MLVSKGVQRLSGVGIPDLAAKGQLIIKRGSTTYAVKSALPVTAREVSREILEDQTAPLWPCTRQYTLQLSNRLTKECADPVAQPAAQHRVAILAARD